VTDPLARSRSDLDAASLLAERGFGAQAVSRAYFATFHAAETALARLGESRSKHSGVLSAFGRLVVVHGGLDEEIGRLLRSLFERRNEADYVPVDVPPEEAATAVADAERFVDAVAAGSRRGANSSLEASSDGWYPGRAGTPYQPRRVGIPAWGRS